MKSKNNILITGGNGFVGRSLSMGLNNYDYNIFSPSHNELDVLDFTSILKFCKEKKIDVIIHAAIKGGENVLPDTLRMFDNVASLSSIVEKVIHLGSGAEYDKSRDIKKITEDDFGRYTPKDDYGFAKYICSKISNGYNNILTLRIFGLYGIYDDYLNKFISNSIVKSIFGLPINIKQNVVFDYLYIDDFVKIVDFFIRNKQKFNFYNVTPLRSISLLKIADIINSLSGGNLVINIDNNGLNNEYTGSNSRLCNELGDFDFTSYKEGIGVIYDYLTKNKQKLDFDAIINDSYYLKAKIKNIYVK